MQHRANKLLGRKAQIEIEQWFAKANEFQKQGLVEQAEVLYLDITEIIPDLALVWDRLGYLYLTQGRVNESILSLLKAYEIEQNSFTTIYNLALAYRKSGNLVNAHHYLEKLEPECSSDIEILTLAGEVNFELGDYHRAEKLFRLAVEHEPRKISLYINWSMALNSLSYYEQSIEVCNLALMYEPNSAMIYFNKAISHKKNGQYQDAMSCYLRVLEIMPGYSPANNNIANLYLQLKMYDTAIYYYEKCLLANSNDYEVLGNLGDAYYLSNRYNESIEYYSKAITINGKNLKILINYANALQAMHRWHEALSLYEQAILLDPNNSKIWCNKGNTLKGLKQWAEARECFLYAKNINPKFVQADWNQAILELTLGNLALGYLLYESRWENPEFGFVNREYSKPLWLGQESISGAHLFIWEEQGLGDKIQMMRYARMLSEKGVQVTIEVPDELVTIANSLSPLVNVVTSGYVPVDFDFHCPYMSLPLACKTMLDTIPNYGAYLSPTTDKINEWKHRIFNVNTFCQKNVGLVWSGSAAHKNDHFRSISLRKILSYVDDSDCLYWSLQKEYKFDDLNYLRDNDQKIVDSSRYLNDFSDTAGLIHHMDYVVSVDTSVAHLAAAMGKKVVLLLSDDPDYRWLNGRIDSPWYNSIIIKKI